MHNSITPHFYQSDATTGQICYNAAMEISPYRHVEFKDPMHVSACVWVFVRDASSVDELDYVFCILTPPTALPIIEW